MDSFDFIKKFQQLELGIAFDEIQDLGFTTIAYWKALNAPFYNWALVDQVLTTTQLLTIEKAMRSYHRIPTLLFENTKKLLPLIDMLKQQGYTKQYEDAWLFHNGKGIPNKLFDVIKKVETDVDLENFLTTFNDSYYADDPQGPYGVLDAAYIDSARDAWIKFHPTNRVMYFIAYKENHPVAISSVTSGKDIGYIANVGVRKEARGQGYGKAITYYATQQSMQYGNQFHCLATEQGTYPYDFYHRLGFTKRFSTLGYSKQS